MYGTFQLVKRKGQSDWVFRLCYVIGVEATSMGDVFTVIQSNSLGRLGYVRCQLSPEGKGLVAFSDAVEWQNYGTVTPDVIHTLLHHKNTPCGPTDWDFDEAYRHMFTERGLAIVHPSVQ